jgi:hexosaminidase
MFVKVLERITMNAGRKQKMKHYFIFLVPLVAALLNSPAICSQEISIVPEPVEISIQKGGFLFSEKTSLVIDDKSRRTAEFFQKRLSDGLGMVFNKGDSGEFVNRLILEINEKSWLAKEAYKLVIDDNITISASDEKGLFYGVQSLLQLMPPEVYGEQVIKMQSFTLPRLTIFDQPRFDYRGFMVDISRHFVSQKDLMKIIDMMAMHNLNVLHIHLTDDHGWRIDIKSYPRLTSVGATGDFSNPNGPEKYFLTQDEMREIIAFAELRHVMVIPKIEMPGHSGAAARAYPEFFDGGKAFNPANAETFTFVEKVMDEVIALFPSPYFHISGDEVSGSTNWLNMPDVVNLMKKNNYKNAAEVEAYFDRKVKDMLVLKGKLPTGWQEVVNLNVNKKTVIQWWLGHIVPSKDLNKALSNGLHVIMSPNWYVYLDYAQAAGEPGAPWNGNINGPIRWNLFITGNLFRIH